MIHLSLNTRKRIIIASLAFIGSMGVAAGILALWVREEYQKLESDDPTVWETVIEDFEKEDQNHPPQKRAVLFIGSSSIRFWRNLEKDMHPLPVIKRGFGGSKIRDVIYYANRIVLPYRPRAIVLFAGSSDISGRPNDKTPQAVLQDFVAFAALVRQKLPSCQLYYLPITPNTGQWQIWPQANEANSLIKAYISAHKNMYYLDVTQHFLTADGKVNEKMLWWDGVHLNSHGYKVWEQEIKRQLPKQLVTDNQ